MKVIESLHEMQATARAMRVNGQSTALVPTMGALHDGHLSLIRQARREADVCLVSLFVNPTQFGAGEDYGRYPRDFERDQQLCEEEGVDILFAPSVETMYPPGLAVFVEEPPAAHMLEGALRPGHFRGVLTIVAKLFNLVLPDVAVFGEKDAQQLFLIRRMTADLNFPLRILSCPTVREPDGLAMSSRNAYLSPEERRDALCLRHALDRAEELFRSGVTHAQEIKDGMLEVIESVQNAHVDYVEVVDYETFHPTTTAKAGSRVVLAVRFGKTRLIDNTRLAQF
jgi:pantoate--beta-alanine ligase